MIQLVSFYIFASIVIASAAMVIFSRNPVHSVLWLIVAFFNAAGLMVLIGAEFIAMLLVIVYVGAVAVLFLFVVMMLDVNFEELRTQFRSYLPVGLLVGAAILLEMILVLSLSFKQQTGPTATTNAILLDGSNTKALGIELFTKYTYAVEIAGVLLLVAIVAAIALTLRDRRETRYQNPGEQVLVKRNDRLRILKMSSEKPTAAETPAAAAVVEAKK